MKIKANKFVILFLIIGVSIPIIIVGKMFYNQYTFSSDESLRTQLIAKVSKAEKVSPEDVEIEKIDSYGKEKILYVVVYYKVEDGSQETKTFRYSQAVFGRIVVGKEVRNQQ